ncbi:cell division protein [Camelliibacillus cellulosilyticus]|uniref:Cell division protein n=1 Tax=Camelliibacillus cellulosilyticus TaxID=2174486 RepID=A0ABV9GMR4_9BACL
MLLTIAKGILSIFYHPLFYLFIGGLFLTGWQRVRRERRSFGIKVYGMFNSVLSSLLPSLCIGFLGSAALLITGVSLPIGYVALVTLLYLICMLMGQLRYLSPTLTIGWATAIASFFPHLHTGVSVFDRWIQEIRSASLFDLCTFLAVVALMEAFAVILWGSQQPSPRLINSKRGKKVGAYEVNRFWIAPLFFLIPVSGAIHPIGWWPLATGTVFGLGALPLGIGLQQLVTHTTPRQAVKKTGAWLLVTGIVLGAVACASYFFESVFLTVSAGAFAVFSRLALVLWHFYQQHAKPLFLVDRGNGLLVVGTIPNTPAAQMGITTGEVVIKVNGLPVRSELDFYKGMQLNAAYCKLEVADRQGEVRFVKSMVHENDLHDIGLLFLEPSRRVKGA